MPSKKKIAFASITAIFCVITIEFALQVLAFVSPRLDILLSSPLQVRLVHDERFGHRPDPAYPDHDKNGFRNPHVPATTHVVALGDSQTYGDGVEAEHAWPRVLELQSGRSVYSMAYGGYGPAHSLLLWDEAIALHPAVVIEAFYAGNDLYDSFNLIYNKGQLPGLKTRDKSRMETITKAEQAEPIAKLTSNPIRAGTRPSATHNSVRIWFSRHSRFYGLLRRTWYELTRVSTDENDEWLQAKSFAVMHPEYTQVFSNRISRTIFTSEYRLSGLNLDDPRIREGQRISRLAIGRMHQRAIRDGIRFIVLLIPTKEIVFSKQAMGIPSGSYHTLVRNELLFWEETKSFLREQSIEYIDALEPLQAQLEAGPQPYKVTRDGHPNALGHRTIAHAVQSYLDITEIGHGN